MSGVTLTSIVANEGVVTLGDKTRLVATPGSRIYSPGSVIQCKTVQAGPGIQTFSSIEPVAVNGLLINFTPIKASSKIIIKCFVATNSTYVSSFGIYKNGLATVSTAGQTNNNQPNMQVTTYYFDDGSFTTTRFHPTPLMHFEDAIDTNARTYQVYATSGWAGTARSLSIFNRSTNNMASYCYMTVMEVA